LNKYRVFETDEFLKSIEKLDPLNKSIIAKKLVSYVYPQLKPEPFFGRNIKKLKGYVPDTWRYRIGKFRIFYTVDQEEEIIYMLTIDHRKDAHR
jgi:mRNA interferase RelE/StbE